MLGKVVKYEFKSSSRILIPLFVLAPVLVLVMRLIFGYAIPAVFPGWTDLSYTLLSMFTMLIVSGINFMVLAALAFRYYKSMSANESYLTFTLPVKRLTLVMGRDIVAFIYGGISILVSSICILLLSFNSKTAGIPGFEDIDILSINGQATYSIKMEQIPSGLKTAAIISFIVISAIGVAYSITLIYTSIAVGTLMNGNRLLGTVVSFFAINVIESIVTALLFILIGGIPVSRFVGEKGGMQGVYNWLESSSNHTVLNTVFNFMIMFIVLAVVLMLVMVIVHFLVNRYIFSKRLNVE